MADENGTEARIILFTEWRKKEGDGHDVEHITFRRVGNMTNDDVLADVKWWNSYFTNAGYEHVETPKQSYYSGGRGGGSGQKKQERIQPTEIIENDKPTGRAEFEVKNVTVFAYNNGKSVKAFGEGGVECVAWDGKAFDQLIKTLQPDVSQPLLNWAEWTVDELHAINWSTHKLIAKCAKSAVKIEDGKQKGGKWYIAAFEVR